MKVRAYDKAKSQYFKSDVYGIVNKGWFEKYLVYAPAPLGDSFMLIDYLDKSVKGPHYPVNINVIHSDYPDTWVRYENDDLCDLHELLKAQGLESERLDYFIGYPEIWANQKTLASVFCGNNVSFKEFSDIETPSTESGWNNIDTQADIYELMTKFHGFYDSVIVSLNYQSGSGKTDGGTIVQDHLRQITIQFDTCWSESIELVFNGVVGMNLRPTPDNYSSDIFGATIYIKDETVYFCNEEAKTEDDFSNSSTWVSVYSLKWRFI